MSAAVIVRLANACNPWNKGAGAFINNWFIGITEAEIAGDMSEDNILPGTVLACNKSEGLLIASSDKKKLKVNIVYLQEGFYSGYRIAEFGVKEGMKFE
jgi:methionyl-tRNA formyltransferase